MSFDLLAYAGAHRYRVRNLHDGHPVPPTLPPPRGRRGRSSAYWAPADRMDAIVGRYGYVCDDGNGRIGWCLFASTVRRLGFKLKKLAALGIVPKQEGDWEAAGDEDPARIEDILKVLEVARIPKHSGNLASLARFHDAQRGTSARQTHAAGLPGTRGSAGGWKRAKTGRKPVRRAGAMTTTRPAESGASPPAAPAGGPAATRPRAGPAASARGREGSRAGGTPIAGNPIPALASVGAGVTS